MRIAIGCDHHGVSLKQSIIKLVTDAGHSCDLNRFFEGTNCLAIRDDAHGQRRANTGELIQFPGVGGVQVYL